MAQHGVYNDLHTFYVWHATKPTINRYSNEENPRLIKLGTQPNPRSRRSSNPCLNGLNAQSSPRIFGLTARQTHTYFEFNMWLKPRMLSLATRQTHHHLSSTYG